MLPLIFLSLIAVSIAAPPGECDLSRVAIINGTFTVSDGGNIGSKVVYSCPEGMYPHPALSRECLYSGKWTKDAIKAVCRTVQCPRPVLFEHGDYFPENPSKKYYVGDVLTFVCRDGYKMLGAGNHTCLPNGKWSGELTRCDDQEGWCPYPGIPFGGTKVGSSYNLEALVAYECQDGLQMFGSNVRQCMKNQRWSGAQPTCRAYYTYDTPEEVASSFSASLAETFESSDPDREEVSSDKKIVVKPSTVNIFMILDASKSVGERNFKTVKETYKIFIEKVSTYDIVPRYAIIAYSYVVNKIVQLRDQENTSPDKVIEKLDQYNYSEHVDKQGTNTRGALNAVYEMLSLDLVQEPEIFRKTRNVILLLTNGKHNMGGDPIVEIRKIQQLLEIKNNREDYLDVYVFGLGEEINEKELNDIASKKDPEIHVFVTKNADALKAAFKDMIDDVEAFQMCGLSKEADENKDDKHLVEENPWIAKIDISLPQSHARCKGSIISKHFILTSAHCFNLINDLNNVSVAIGGGGFQKVKNIHIHPLYNLAAKAGIGNRKSRDYDVALLELTDEINFCKKLRPICIPCTKSATWALKQRGKDVTCNDHKRILLSGNLVRAMFVAEETPRRLQRMNVLIKQGNKRLGCLDDAKKVRQYENVTDITDIVTDNFLCTGGTEPQEDPQTCKGDGGGPLIVPFKKRYIQVGVLSWGTIHSCIGSRRNVPVPPASRDFHINVFSILDWIKEVLKEELEFLK